MLNFEIRGEELLVDNMVDDAMGITYFIEIHPSPELQYLVQELKALITLDVTDAIPSWIMELVRHQILRVRVVQPTDVADTYVF
jgi:hypothetical protein